MYKPLILQVWWPIQVFIITLLVILPLIVVVVGVLFITTIYASHKVNHIHGLGQLTTHYAFSWPMDTSTPTTSVVGRCKVRNLRLGLHQSLNLLGQCLNMLSKGKSSCFSFHLVDRPLHDSPIPIIVVGIGAHVPYHLDGIRCWLQH